MFPVNKTAIQRKREKTKMMLGS